MLEKMKYTWKKIYAYILPTFFTIAYLVYFAYMKNGLIAKRYKTVSSLRICYKH